MDRACGTGIVSGEAAQAHTSLPWAPRNPLEMLIVVYKLCRSAVEHHCGLGGSHAVLPS